MLPYLRTHCLYCSETNLILVMVCVVQVHVGTGGKSFSVRCGI